MKYREYFNSKLLENRVKKLERLVYEKTVGRGGSDSRAYTIWKLLRDEGPMTRPAIRNALGYTTPIVEMEAENCVTKNGNMYSANLDYNWEDIGVIPRTRAQEIQQAMQQSTTDDSEAEVDSEVPVSRRTRQPRTPREPRQRTVVPNIFSRKLPEVKAAVEQGTDINSRDSNDRTPIVWACMNKKNDEATEIVKYLLEHGADPNSESKKGTPLLITAIRNDNYELAKQLLDHGANPDCREYRKAKALWVAIDNRKANLIKLLLDHNVSVDRDDRLLGDYRWPFKLLVRAIRDMPGEEDLLFRLIPNRLPSNIATEFIRDASNEYLLGNISESTYNNLITELLRHFEYVKGYGNYNIPSSVAIGFRKHNTKLADELIKKYNVFPDYKYSEYLQGDALNLYYDYLKRYKDIKHSDIRTFISEVKHVAETLNEDSSWVDDLLDEKWFSSENVSDENIRSVLTDAVINDNTKALLAAAKGLKRVVPGLADSLVTSLSNGYGINNKLITRLVCRILNKQLRNVGMIDKWTLAHLIRLNNKYLFDYLIDRGGLDYLLEAAAEYGIGRWSDEFKQALTENGVDPNNMSSVTSSLDKTRELRKYNRLVERLIELIISDDSFRDVEGILRTNPELLGNADVVEAINDPKNDESITARQLRRRLTDYNANKPKDKYDM